MGTSRRVLAVARTLTSLNRVLEVLDVFADDVRVQVEFVVSPGSRFGAEVPAVLDRLGARTIRWSEAVGNEFDLVVSASDHGDLYQLRGPLVLLPHGAGFQKYSPHAAAGSTELAGLTRDAWWHEGRIVPALVALSHENQHALIPELDGRMFVAGDPELDALTELSGQRELLRQVLGVRPDQKLVTLTSTWGPRSVLGRWPTLPAQLPAELPWDEFRVAAVLHPNVWAAHGPWQVRHWLQKAVASGLILLPPDGPWQLGLAAADCVIGDHGSLSAYAAGLSIPLLMATFGDEEVPPESVMWRLGEAMPKLDGRFSLAEQVRRASLEVDRPVLERLSGELFSQRGRSLQILQSRLYGVLRLEPVTAPSRRRGVPDWPAVVPDVRAFQVEVSSAGGGEFVVERFPAALTEFTRPARSRRLVAFGNAEEVVLQMASAIIARAPADGWAEELLDRYPGCRTAVADYGRERIVLTGRDGSRILASCRGQASGAHALLAASVWSYRPVSQARVALAGAEARIRFTAL